MSVESWTSYDFKCGRGATILIGGQKFSFLLKVETASITSCDKKVETDSIEYSNIFRIGDLCFKGSNLTKLEQGSNQNFIKVKNLEKLGLEDPNI